MNEPTQLPKKLEYQAPTLEQHPPFIAITGVSLPFGALSEAEGDVQ